MNHPKEGNGRNRRLRGFGHLLRSLAVVCTIAVVSSGLSHLGWFEGFESATLDTLLILKANQYANHVVIVGIDALDYQEYFHGTSPLNKTQIREILNAIRKGNPAIIGVDVETHPLPSVADEDLPRIPIVWAATTEARSLEAVTGSLYGLAVMPKDRDGIVRRHKRSFQGQDGTGKPASSMPWAIVRAYCSRQDRQTEAVCRKILEGERNEDLLINFTGHRYLFPTYSVKSVLMASEGGQWGSEMGALRDKIVLLGGMYPEARDLHITPVGEMAGVELLAQVIESELRMSGIRPANELLMFVTEIIGGLAIVIFFRLFPFRTAFWLNLLGIPLVACASSVVSFYTLARWANFAPVLFGTLIHQLYESNLAAVESQSSARP